MNKVVYCCIGTSHLRPAHKTAAIVWKSD